MSTQCGKPEIAHCIIPTKIWPESARTSNIRFSTCLLLCIYEGSWHARTFLLALPVECSRIVGAVVDESSCTPRTHWETRTQAQATCKEGHLKVAPMRPSKDYCFFFWLISCRIASLFVFFFFFKSGCPAAAQGPIEPKHFR